MTWFAQRASGAKAPVSVAFPSGPMARGTMLVEYQHLPSGRPYNVVRSRLRDPEPAGFTLRVDPCGTALLLLHGSGIEADYRLEMEGVPAGARVLLWYVWGDFGAVLAATIVEQSRHIICEFDTHVPFGRSEAARLLGGADCVDGTKLAAAEGCYPVGPMPGLTAAARVRTFDGAKRVDQLAAGDVLMGGDGEPVQVRWVGQTALPCVGSFGPSVIHAPQFGATRDLRLSQLQRVAMGGTEVEYLFSQPMVLAAAGDLVGDSQSDTVVERYFGVVLDRDVPMLVNGVAVPGMDVTPMLKDPVLARHSVLAGFPMELIPRRQTSGLPLQPFEARSLARARAAAQVPLYGAS